MRDHRIIEKEFLPVVRKLDEQGVSTFSFCLFFAHYLGEILNTMEDDAMKETIIRRFMD